MPRWKRARFYYRIGEILEQVKKYKFKYTEVPVTVVYNQYSLQKGQKISNSKSKGRNNQM